MLRRIIQIDQEKCNGCGLCAAACHEGAIGMRDGKAVLLREDSCDGLGDCLPACPMDAIRFEEREAAPYRVPGGSSRLTQWPVQLRLVPARAACFAQARLLIAADCTAFACGDFHERFMKGCVTLIGCPKLDDIDYAEKLTEILRENTVREITVARMEVPCCGGLVRAVRRAIENSGKSIPCKIITVSTKGQADICHSM